MLSDVDVEADLSYAYLHAVACRGGFECTQAPRHSDNAGIDAFVKEDGRKLAPTSTFTSFTLEVQLKATKKKPIEQDGYYSYSLTVRHYDKIRNEQVFAQRLLVVLYLPDDATEWLRHSEDCLVSKRCAYWMSLRGAPDSQNPKHQTVYIPKKQILSVDSLTAVMTRVSLGQKILHDD